MSRWITAAGLATILISLVALAALSGGSGPPEDVEAGAQQQQDATETPEIADPEPEPSTTPEPPATTPETTTPEPTAPGATSPDQENAQAGQPQDEGAVQDVQPGDRGTVGPVPRVATIEVAGNARYSCSIGLIDSPRTVRGTGPDAYQIRVSPGGSSLDAVMAACQKISGEELGVGIIYDNEVKAQDNTTERFGTAAVSWSPIQDR